MPQWLFPAVSVIWILTELGLFVFKRINNSRQDLSLRYLWIVISSSTIIGVFLGLNGVGQIVIFRDIIHFVGITFIILGLILRWVSIITLWRYFSVNVSVSEGQRVVENGIYSVLRHPSYTGALFSFFGLGLALISWASLLVIFIPVCAAFLYRVRIEEKLLLEKLGDPYRSYLSRTKRFIPGLF